HRIQREFLVELSERSLQVRLEEIEFAEKDEKEVGHGQLGTVSANCTYGQFAFGMGRNLSSFPPTTWPTFRSPQEATRSRCRHAHSPRAGTWHPQRPARVDRLGRSVPG